jgi:pimeloyl-ACP methyl ester carboxylesterase
MMFLEEDAGVAAHAVTATVHAGGTLMQYWRGGAGPAVLLVQGRVVDFEHHDRWRSVLATRFRLYAPAPVPPGGAGADEPLGLLLQRFLEGIGLRRVAIVADGETAGEALWLALLEPERIERILIILPGSPDPEAPAALLSELVVQRRLPVLAVRMMVPAADTEAACKSPGMARALSFLAGEE